MKTILFICSLMLTVDLSALSQTPGASEEDSSEKRASWKPLEPKTIGVQILSGTGGGIIGSSVFYVAYIGTHDHFFDASMFFALATLSALAVPTAVQLGGDWMGGNGRYLWTVIGGVGAGGVAFLPGVFHRYGGPRQFYIPAIFFAIAGSLLGYHLSASEAEFLPNITLESGQSRQSGVDCLPGKSLGLMTVSIRF